MWAGFLAALLAVCFYGSILAFVLFAQSIGVVLRSGVDVVLGDSASYWVSFLLMAGVCLTLQKKCAAVRGGLDGAEVFIAAWGVPGGAVVLGVFSNRRSGAWDLFRSFRAERCISGEGTHHQDMDRSLYLVALIF